MLQFGFPEFLFPVQFLQAATISCWVCPPQWVLILKGVTISFWFFLGYFFASRAYICFSTLVLGRLPLSLMHSPLLALLKWLLPFPLSLDILLLWAAETDRLPAQGEISFFFSSLFLSFLTL